MIANILSIISSLLTLAGKIFDYLHERQMIDVGRTEEKMAELSRQVNQAHKALQARIAVERDIAANPDSLLNDDDGFKRPD